MTSFDDLWERYYSYSGKASDNVRNSAIAGLAAVWLFSDPGEASRTALETAPGLLLIAGGFFAASLGLDILHYFVAAETVKRYTESREDAHEGPKEDVDVTPPRGWMRWPTWFYRSKVLALAIGYALMVIVLIDYAS